MNYKSPIELIMSDMQIRMEGEICKAVQNVGVNVDKDELLKALQYDRNQYQKGYDDRDSEIVRCKDCKHYRDIPGYCAYDRIWQENKGHVWGMYCQPDWFCADGERREEDA